MFMLFYLHKFFKLYISQTQNCLNSCFLLLILLLRGFLLLIQWSSSRFIEFSLECFVVGSSFIRKRGMLAEMTICCTTRCHLLCHSLSLVVPLVVIRCHLLSFVAPLVVIRCHSLSSEWYIHWCITRLSF